MGPTLYSSGCVSSLLRLSLKPPLPPRDMLKAWVVDSIPPGTRRCT